MPVSFVVSENVSVDSEEFYEKLSLGAFDQFQEKGAADPQSQIEFSDGAVSFGEMIAPFAMGDEEAFGEVVPFQPIGFGKPLSVEILGLYTGNVPFFFGFGKPDMVILSGVKSVETLDAVSKAINLLQKDVKDRQYFIPSTESEGSPVVYYTPSLTNSRLTIDVTMAADTFDQGLIKFLSGLIKSAKGLPVFAMASPAASAALVAAPAVVEILGGIGDVFLESKPFLKQTLGLHFDTPGFERTISSTFFAYNLSDKDEFKDYNPRLVNGGQPDQHMVMMNSAGDKYAGDAPYIIMNLDGRNRDQELGSFTPKLASAALMQKFFGSQDPGGDALASLEKAMELYNDFSFRSKLTGAQKQLDGLDEHSPEYEEKSAELKEKIDAYKKNIRNKEFIPSNDDS